MDCDLIKIFARLDRMILVERYLNVLTNTSSTRNLIFKFFKCRIHCIVNNKEIYGSKANRDKTKIKKRRFISRREPTKVKMNSRT